MNQKPNKHKRINFNTTTMTSLGVHSPSPPLNLAPAPAPPQIQFFDQVLPKINGRGGGAASCYHDGPKKYGVSVLPFIFPSVCKFSRNCLIIFF